MKKLLAAIAAAAALLGAGAGQANVLTFDDPGVIEIDGNNLATYTENGFAFYGSAASFLPLDARLVGGIDGAMPLGLRAVGGGAFSLMSFDYSFYDLGFGDPAGSLSVLGFRNGVQVASQLLQLGNLATASFGAAFGNLTAVTFTGSTAFALDNVNLTPIAAIPEPGTAALASIALLGVALHARRRRKAG